jgi:hypothetical protein
MGSGAAAWASIQGPLLGTAGRALGLLPLLDPTCLVQSGVVASACHLVSALTCALVSQAAGTSGSSGEDQPRPASVAGPQPQAPGSAAEDPPLAHRRAAGGAPGREAACLAPLERKSRGEHSAAIPAVPASGDALQDLMQGAVACIAPALLHLVDALRASTAPAPSRQQAAAAAVQQPIRGVGAALRCLTALLDAGRSAPVLARPLDCTPCCTSGTQCAEPCPERVNSYRQHLGLLPSPNRRPPTH